MKILFVLVAFMIFTSMLLDWVPKQSPIQLLPWILLVGVNIIYVLEEIRDEIKKLKK